VTEIVDTDRPQGAHEQKGRGLAARSR
jgi:hypothetical protein